MCVPPRCTAGEGAAKRAAPPLLTPAAYTRTCSTAGRTVALANSCVTWCGAKLLMPVVCLCVCVYVCVCVCVCVCHWGGEGGAGWVSHTAGLRVGRAGPMRWVGVDPLPPHCGATLQRANGSFLLNPPAAC